MLTFRQMEKYFSVVDLIQRYETVINQIDTGIATARIDSSSNGISADPHRIEQMLIRKEKALSKLPILIALRDDNLQYVENTITKATEKAKPSIRLKHQMLFRMRYLQGRSWPEIEAILKITHPEKVAQKLLER